MDKIPQDILFKTRTRRNNEIPNKMFVNTDIPETIRVYYDDRINYDQINKTIERRLELLNRKEDYTTYLKKIEPYIKDGKIESFLDIADNYINIERIQYIENNFNCTNCNKELEEILDNKEYIYCKYCNCINNVFVPNIYNRDLDKQTKKSEEDITNFEKVIDKFEGKQVNIIDQEIIEKLDNYFNSIGFKSRKEILDLKCLPNGKKPFTTKKILWNALENIKHKYYEDTNYIAHIYWGWELPNLSNYRFQILLDYRKTQKVWLSIRHKYNRTASLGTQFRLYVHLYAVSYEHAYLEDFKIQDNVESLRLHNEAWKIMCDKTGLKYTSITI